MGFFSILVQIIVLRGLLSVFSGNELDLGITLAAWLALVGVGSAIGHRITRSIAFAWSFIALSCLVQPTILFIEFIRPLFGLTQGETVSFSITLLSTLLALAPACIVIGAQFPLSVLFLKGDASRAYGLEAAGAFLGGLLFTFFLSGRVNAVTLSAGIGMFCVLIALLLAKNRWWYAFFSIPIVLYLGAQGIIETTWEDAGETIERTESRYGELTVLEAEGQLNVYASSRFDFSYPDAQTEEVRAHVPMSLHPAPTRVLVVGGSPAVARECLKYPVTNVDFAELDPAMIDVSFRILSNRDRELLQDKRLKVFALDARKYLGSVTSRYDVVILNLAEPATANLNRFYTVEFFREAKAAMDKTGILCLTLPASHGYIGKRMQAANGSVYQSLGAVFKNVAVTSEEYGGMYASDNPIVTDADALMARFSARHAATEYFYPFLFKDLFDPLKTDMVKQRLGAIKALNRDRRPVAYLYNLMLWAETYGGRPLNLVFGMGDRSLYLLFVSALLTAVSAFWRKKTAVYYSLFTTGYASLAFTVVVLLAYQASYGYVYEKLGLLTALFMAGAAAGAYRARGITDALTWLQALETGSLLLFLSAPLCFKAEPLYYALVLFAGMISGMQFTIANRLLDRKKPGELAGRLYALDLGGSVLGALATALVVVPLLGIGNAVVFLILVKTSSLALLFSLNKARTER